MDNEKNDSYYVEKIKSDLEFVIVHTKGKTMEEIKADELLTDSIMFRIIQIAENNSKLSADFKTKHKEVPWMAIKGMRNKIVHDYGVIDLTFVYSTVTHAMPDMYEKLKDVQ
ncbi:MAG: DUF86 domain-containing protein [Spirochaetales bacterium]|nr:DUF86 domain-containing protein [Spirochaetales bacterium]